MSPDTMTAGDWTLCALYLAIWLAFTAWLILSGRRELRGAADEATPMSGEVVAQHIRDALHAELTAAGVAVAELERDYLEELWKASP